MNGGSTGGGLEPLPEWELAFRFEGGLLPLTFTATVGERWRRGFERLTSPQRWAEWIVEAGLAQTAPAVTATDLEQAQVLREAIHRSVRAVMDARPLAVGDVALLNRWGSRPPVGVQVNPAGQRELLQAADHCDRILADLARQTIDLITDEKAMQRVRECGAPDCALLFYDASRPGHRRWCSDGTCGTRNRTRRRRSRTNDESSHPE